MNKDWKDRSKSNLEDALEQLKDVPERDPQLAERGRANFLKQAAVLRQAASREKESTGARTRKSRFFQFRRWGLVPVWKPVLAGVLALVVFMAAGTGTVYAAQESLPDQSLYPVKIWSEDSLLSLASSNQARLDYTLNFSDRRITELTDMLAAGMPVPQSLETRYRGELRSALELATGLQDPLAIQEMAQIQQRARYQMQRLQQEMYNAPGSDQALLSRIQANLEQQVQLTEMGAVDLPGLRLQLRQGMQGQSTPRQATPGMNEGSGAITPEPIPPASGQGTGPNPDGNIPGATSAPSGPNQTGPYQIQQPGGGSGPMGPSGTPGSSDQGYGMRAGGR